MRLLHDSDVERSPRDVPPQITQLERSTREAKIAILLLFPGMLIALVATAVWQLSMNTASMGGDESTMVRGWEGFVRNLPVYLLTVGVAATSLVFAARAMRHGKGATGGQRHGPGVLIASSLALLFALGSVTRDSAEVVMTTRAATVSWALFLVDVVAVAMTVLLSSRYWRAGQGKG